VGIDGKQVKTLDDLLSAVDAKKPGEAVTLNILREGKEYQVPLTLVESE